MANHLKSLTIALAATLVVLPNARGIERTLSASEGEARSDGAEAGAGAGGQDPMLAAVMAVADVAPREYVQVDLFEGIPEERNWAFTPPERLPVYRAPALALTELPRKYNDKGIITDRQAPLMIHAYAEVALPAGTYALAVRSLNAARLYIDDRLVVETPFLELDDDGHGEFVPVRPAEGGRPSLPLAHHEQVVTYKADGESHVVSLLALIGHKDRPIELGEMVVSYAPSGEPFRLLASPDRVPFDDASWMAFTDRERQARRRWEAEDRRKRSREWQRYWDDRHVLARELVRADTVDQNAVDAERPAAMDSVDRFIDDRLEHEGIKPMPLVDDLRFLRRVTLDITGLIPSPEQIDRFLALPAATRRSEMIDQLLEEPGWADHWVGYWQHVLAENPGLIKPTLNNSGPFRWFLYDAFTDNRAADRWVTELILMEGSVRDGGTAGFGIATHNDAPLAAKAHVLGAAFLGIDMTCARCHDAPAHDWTQQDLFSLAAMLHREPLAVPESSTVPGSEEELAEMAVTVSLRPGVPVEPRWPFPQLVDPDSMIISEGENADADSRARLARYITHPENRRFARVMVNRLWERYLGRGLIDSLHDWDWAASDHDALLQYLATELATHGYDLKHVARLILNSRAYQRQIDLSPERARRQRWFASPTRRRMTAEQLVDSMLLAVGKTPNCEELCINGDGRQKAGNYLNLGTPLRAWQLACTSNERERPSLSLPRAQMLADLMMAYGWRQNRQEPAHTRDHQATSLQPLALANGAATNRAIDLSDDGALVGLCLQDQSVQQLVDALFVRLLTREPSEAERESFAELLAEGYAERIVESAQPRSPEIERWQLSWSAHLSAEANRVGEELQRAAFVGDPPTQRLTAAWRERVEDMVWVLINSPEFVFVP